MSDLAAIQPVLQHLIQIAPQQRPTTARATLRQDPPLGGDALCRELLLQQANRAEFCVKPEYTLNLRRLSRVDHQLAVTDVEAERRVAAHPHALSLGRSDLVANAFAGDLALELRKGQQHVQRQPAHRGRRVELLSDRDERHVARVEHINELGKVGQRSRQPIHLIDNHQVDPLGPDVVEQPGQGRTVHRAARDTAIVVEGRQRPPSLMTLTEDVGLASLTLRMQRVELLFEPLLR